MPHSFYVLLAEYTEYLNLRSITANTVKNHRTSLNVFRQWAEDEEKDFLSDFSELTRKDVRRFFYYRKIEQQVGNGALKANYNHLDQFFRWIKSEYKILKKNPLKGVEKPTYRPPLVEFPDVDIIEKMISTCDTSFKGIRDRALLLLYRDTGGRATEILRLTEADIDMAEQVISIRFGKGGKTREVPYSDDSAIALMAYAIARRDQPLAYLSNFFIGRRYALGYGGLRDMFYARSLMVSDKKLSPHKFRHAFVHEAKIRGITEDALLELCGWSNRTQLDHYGRSMRKERANSEYRAKMGRSKEE